MWYGFWSSLKFGFIRLEYKTQRTSFFEERKKIVCIGILFFGTQKHVIRSNMCTFYNNNLHTYTLKKVSPYNIYEFEIAVYVRNEMLMKWYNRLNASSSYFTAFVCVVVEKIYAHLLHTHIRYHTSIHLFIQKRQKNKGPALTTLSHKFFCLFF